MVSTPADYGIHHLPSWRPEQHESVLWALDLPSDGNTVGILEGPTGSGKSACCGSVAYHHRLISLVKTKALQEVNYGQELAFDVLMGKANYECIHHDAGSPLPGFPAPTAADCLYKTAAECSYVHTCPYHQAKVAALSSGKVTLNYALWAVVRSWWPRPEYLFLDECHELSDTICDQVGARIHEKDRQRWRLPRFPITCSAGSDRKRFQALGIAKDWLQRAYSILIPVYDELSEKEKSAHSANGTTLRSAGDYTQLVNDTAECWRVLSKVRGSLMGIATNDDYWFINSGPSVVYYKGANIAGIEVRPLSARGHFHDLFGKHASQLVLMSATIGAPSTFTEELGIQSRAFRVMPHQYPKERRPIYVLKGAPSIGKKTVPADYETQADVIARAIADFPPDWPGLIHVTRMAEAPLLAARLAKRGLADRVWPLPTGLSTGHQVQAWHDRMDKVPGSIGIAWFFWSGYDGIKERINIIAKIPWPYLGSIYEQERLALSRRFYMQRTAWRLEQGLGRSRRSSRDYDTDDEMHNFVAIADANFGRVKSYLSTACRESLVYL